MALFQEHGFNPRTDLGQNFLIDINLIDYIVAQSNLTSDDVVLEVGAGTGGMTAFLAQQAGAVVSVEVDRNMHELASATVADFDNVTLLKADILKNKNTLSSEVLDVVNERLAEDPARRLKLVSNLPYSVATPVVSNLVATDLPWTRMVVTIQWELGQKMAAKAGKSQYGALSVWLQAQCGVKVLKRLQNTVFWPRPKVTSAIVRLVPKPHERANIADRDFFHDYVRRLFHQRRKFLRSVVVGMYRKQLTKSEIDTVLQGIELPDGERAENLDVATHLRLSNRLYAAIQVKTAADVTP